MMNAARRDRWVARGPIRFRDADATVGDEGAVHVEPAFVEEAGVERVERLIGTHRALALGTARLERCVCPDSEVSEANSSNRSRSGLLGRLIAPTRARASYIELNDQRDVRRVGFRTPANHACSTGGIVAADFTLRATLRVTGTPPDLHVVACTSGLPTSGGKS